VPDDLANVGAILAVLRREGVPFGDAWAAAYPASRADRDRVAVRAALTETADAWRRAYVGDNPTPGEAATVFLAGLWTERVDDGEPIGDLVASRCG
jgi:hypothetical protein